MIDRHPKNAQANLLKHRPRFQKTRNPLDPAAAVPALDTEDERMTLQIRRLAYGLGAEVRGVDLSALDSDAFDAIHAAWMEHLVLVFPDQELADLQFARFSERFGTLEVLGSYQGLDEYFNPACKGLMTLTNRSVRNQPSRTRGVGRKWHADRSYSLQSPIASFLYCRELPDVGGNTLFSNQYMAYDSLSDKLKSVLRDLWAVHDVFGRRDSSIMAMDPEQLIRKRELEPPIAQPVVRIHDVTGKPALYVSEAVTTRFEGMTEDESWPLLSYLFQHSIDPCFTYRHAWRVNDVVMWDNRCAMHLALADFDQTQIRTMLRTSVIGPVTGRPLEAATGRPAVVAAAA